MLVGSCPVQSGTWQRQPPPSQGPTGALLEPATGIFRVPLLPPRFGPPPLPPRLRSPPLAPEPLTVLPLPPPAEQPSTRPRTAVDEKPTRQNPARIRCPFRCLMRDAP